MIDSTPNLDWSTSYQAGSSSPASSSSISEDDTDDNLPLDRGRAYSVNRLRNSPSDTLKQNRVNSRRTESRQPNDANSADSGGSSGVRVNGRDFTRSRSPAVVRPSQNLKATPKSQLRTLSPSVSSRHRPPSVIRHVLPAIVKFHIHIRATTWSFCIDSRKAGECLLLLCSLSYAAFKLSGCCTDITTADLWILIELYALVIISFLYIIWTHSSASNAVKPLPPSPAVSARLPGSPRVSDLRDSRRNSNPVSPGKKGNFGFIWMSVPKNYRESSDDGILTGLLFGPLIASALLYASIQQSKSVSVLPSSPLPPSWKIEPPLRLVNPNAPATALEALVLSRYSLVNLATFCSTIFLFHVCASWWIEARYSAPESERASVPRSEGWRSWYYILFTFGVSFGAYCVRVLFAEVGWGIWQHMNHFEVVFGALFFQFALYIAIRLAHRGFTLGELGIVCFGGIALCMELVNLTIAGIWPITTPFIKTYRLPTPLLIFQMALIPGALLVGFLLSPILLFSRHLAQRPVRRLRFPQEKRRHRRALAGAFYIGAVLVVGGLIGMWTRWCLGKRNPWLWAIFWVLEGRKKWSRSLLLAYWALLGSISVAGWNRQMARSRRYRPMNSTGEPTIVPGAFDVASIPSSDQSTPTTPTSGAGGMGIAFPNLPNGATDLLDAADKHVPTLSLNARRKFFHALAVVMFLPGVAFDPAFAHLSFSAAFALFTFAEYVRYFAIYPFGAAVHLFMNEFLDHKDGGTAILSHFYLLTGCAGSVWLEGQSSLLNFTGIFVLGVGDALASIVGRRIGRHRWSPTTFKTLEGSAAFSLSIIISAWILRLCGLTEEFSIVWYAVVVSLSSLLEALSVQNDNLTLPLYMWSMLVLVGEIM